MNDEFHEDTSQNHSLRQSGSSLMAWCTQTRQLLSPTI